MVLFGFWCGCTHRRQPQDSTVASSGESGGAGPSQTEEAPAHLTWFVHREGRTEQVEDAEQVGKTAWISADGSVREVRQGLFVAVGERLWRYETESVERSFMDCECLTSSYDLPEEKQEERRDECVDAREDEVDRLIFRELGEGETHQIPLEDEAGWITRAFEDSGALHESLGSFTVSRIPRASVGPLLTVTSCFSVYGCGAAHPSSHCRQKFWGLNGEEPTSRPEIREQILETDEGLRDEAFAKLTARVEERGSDVPSEWAAEELSPTAGWPAWTGDGPVMRRQFTLSVSYAGSDGRWNSYTKSARVDSEAHPQAFEDFREVPEGVADFWERQDAMDGQGFSRVDPDHAERHWKNFSGDSSDDEGD